MTGDVPLVVDLLSSLKTVEGASATPAKLAELLGALEGADFNLFSALEGMTDVD